MLLVPSPIASYLRIRDNGTIDNALRRIVNGKQSLTVHGILS